MDYDTFPNIRFELPVTISPMQPTIKNQFEAGYSQVSLDGLNRVQISIELKFGNISAADREILSRFAGIHGVVRSFLWTMPGDTVATLWRMVSLPARTYRSHTGNAVDPHYQDWSVKLERVYA
jgi:phage-related protein